MKGKDNSMYLLITLMALLVSNVYFAALTQQGRRVQVERIEEHQAAYDEHAQQLQAWRTQQQRLLDSIADSYRADAYDPGIERIAEQQLIAAEYQILLLQTIAQQNAEIIELMLVGP